MTGSSPHSESSLSPERTDLLQALRQQRFFLRNTARELTDAQAATCSTVSALCIGGLIKHVADVERGWADFIVDGPAEAPDHHDPAVHERHAQSFRLLPGETLAGVLAAYDEVAARTDELIRSLPDLDASQPLPAAPWFEPGARWSARRVLVHVIAETSQHAGHADIIREAIDGAKSMG
ncbi:DinB family protein [Micromonospora sp. NPDC049903]|uniref:DinB family protein n=1 Tax=Micromonospora sp. NPDC049903 TaxID=3364276 RepID=UPI0037A33C2E